MKSYGECRCSSQLERYGHAVDQRPPLNSRASCRRRGSHRANHGYNVVTGELKRVCGFVIKRRCSSQTRQPFIGLDLAHPSPTHSLHPRAHRAGADELRHWLPRSKRHHVPCRSGLRSLFPKESKRAEPLQALEGPRKLSLGRPRWTWRRRTLSDMGF